MYPEPNIAAVSSSRSSSRRRTDGSRGRGAMLAADRLGRQRIWTKDIQENLGRKKISGHRRVGPPDRCHPESTMRPTPRCAKRWNALAAAESNWSTPHRKAAYWVAASAARSRSACRLGELASSSSSRLVHRRRRGSPRPTRHPGRASDAGTPVGLAAAARSSLRRIGGVGLIDGFGGIDRGPTRR